MALTNKIYDMQDFVEQDIETAPSLDLPSIVVERYFRPQDDSEYLVFFANQSQTVVPGDCPNCNTSEHWKRAGNGKPRKVHDVERNNFRVDIVILPKRFECKKCGVKVTPPIEGIAENVQATTRLMDFLRRECLLQPLNVLAQRSGFSEDTIQNIMREEAEKYDAERLANPLPAPRVLGIDEKHITKKMRGTLVNVETGRLLNMLENNKEKTMREAIMQLKDWDTNIQVVTMDMSNAYVRWINDLLPNATIVVDRFHVVQDIQKSITKTRKLLYHYRKDLLKKIDDPEERARQQDRLNDIDKNSRLFNYSAETLMREKNSSKLITLVNIMEEFPEFRLLRLIYSGLENVYDQETYEAAEEAWNAWTDLLPPTEEKKYQEWCDMYSVIPSLFEDFRRFKRTGFQRFKPYILNYFRPGCRETNGATEGVNTLIEKINREGSGLKFESLRAKSLYASLVNKRIRYGIDLKTIKTWTPTMSMSWGSESGGSYTYAKKLVFTSSEEAVEIPHTNVLQGNEQLLKLLSEKQVDQNAQVYQLWSLAVEDFIEIVWADQEIDWWEEYDGIEDWEYDYYD